MKRWHNAFISLCMLALGISGAQAQTLIEEWGTAQFPPAPKLKPAKINAKETALLVMDFTNQTCSQQRRPRCATSVPKVLKFVRRPARKAH